jgi:hypothetical protein
MATWEEFDGSKYSDLKMAEVEIILTTYERFCGVNLWKGWLLDRKKQLAEWLSEIDLNEWSTRHDSQGVTTVDVEYLLEPPILETEETEE